MTEIEKIHNEELKIDIYDVLRDIMKDFWLIVIFGMSVALCAFVISDVLYQPSYATRTTFAVTSRGSNNTYDNLAAANTVASSLTSIFDGELIKKRVAMDIGTDKIPDYITAEVIPETNLFVLTVSAPTPEIAYRIIISVMENYTSVTNHLYQNAMLDVLETPTIPLYPNNPLDLNYIMRMAFLIGSFVMILLLAVLSVTRDNIKNEKEVALKLDTRLFGVVYHEKIHKTLRSRIHRKKKSILITSPTVSFAFVESMKKIRSKFEFKTSAEARNVLLVTSVLENEGKSTVATNLALALAQKSKKVLLMDADFCKPSLYKILQKNVMRKQEFGEYLMKKTDFKDTLMVDENSGIFLLIGSNYYDNSADMIAGTSFSEAIEVLKKEMDYIIIDSPPITVSADTELLADIADSAILVVRQSYAKTRHINDAIDILAGTKAKLLGCIYNNVHQGLFNHKAGYGSKYSNRGYYGYYSADTAYPTKY